MNFDKNVWRGFQSFLKSHLAGKRTEETFLHLSNVQKRKIGLRCENV